MSTKVVPSSHHVSSAFAVRVPGLLKFTYGAGAAAETIIGVAFNAFNFFFYTNIMGVPGTLAGLAITIALFFDAVTDPLVGAISDRWALIGSTWPDPLCLRWAVFRPEIAPRVNVRRESRPWTQASIGS